MTKKLLVAISVMAAALSIAFISPAAAQAAGRTDQIVQSFGRGTMLQQPNASQGSMRFVNYVSDEACDSHETRFYWEYDAPGGGKLAGGSNLNPGVWDADNEGCNTVETFAHTLSVSQLRGNRSGYVKAMLCEHAGIHTSSCHASSWPWKI